MSGQRKTELLSHLKAYSDKSRPLIEHCDSEQQTKISIINPFIELLGHAVNDPRQVKVEFTVDVRINREKVDYAILNNIGEPSIFIEAKQIGTNLNNPLLLNQINSYANQVNTVKFIALTDGQMWHWFKKESHPSGGYQIDQTPFLIHDVLNPGKIELSFLCEISGRDIDLTSAEDRAVETKISTLIEDWLKAQLSETTLDPEFIKLLTKKIRRVRTANKTSKTKKAWLSSFPQFIERHIEERLRNVRGSVVPIDKKRAETQEIEVTSTRSEQSSEASDVSEGQSKRFQTKNGVVELSIKLRDRAWREVGADHWTIETTARDLFVNIVKQFATLHDYGSTAYYESLSKISPNNVSNDPEVISSRVKVAPLEAGYFINVNLSNNNKQSLLEKFEKSVVIDSRHVRPQEKVEWWLV